MSRVFVSDFWPTIGGLRNRGKLPPLTEKQILKWADEYKKLHEDYPKVRCESQLVPNSNGEVWFNIDMVLRKGFRGLPGGSSLFRLIREHRG